MYYIYHIPGVKIGVSTEPTIRVANQGHTDFEILEQHTDINIASDREIELQLQYFGKRDNARRYAKTIEAGRKGAKIGGRIGGKIVGKIVGRKNVETGHLASISSKGGKIGGKTTGSIERTCPHCSTPIKGAIYFRYHGERCKHKQD